MTWSETALGVGCWTMCSVGMMVFNKLAIGAFPLPLTLVAVQMSCCVLAMVIFCWRTIHIGSWRDLFKWLAVTPFFVGMLLTSMLALQEAPMTLVVTFRVLSPLLSLFIERFYPSPTEISPGVVASIFLMVFGTVMYASAMPRGQFRSIQWVALNVLFGTADRLLQRLLLAKDQYPVDLSKSAATLLNNLLGVAPMIIAAHFKGELAQVPAALAVLGTADWLVLGASCVVGVGISYSGIWAQSLISATSFLVLVNANKFAIVFIEVLFLHKKANLRSVQVAGAILTIVAGAAYGKAREWQEAESLREEKRKASSFEAKKGRTAEEAEEGEHRPLLPRAAPTCPSAARAV